MAKRLAMTGAVSEAPPDRGAPAALAGPVAGLGLRSLAFLLDSIVLLAFALIFAVGALLNLFLRSDYGRGDPPDSAYWTAIAIFMLTVPAWLLLNLILAGRRGQSVGHYVIGLRVVREDGAVAEPRRHLLRLLSLHPLVFHPLLALSWGWLAFMAVSIAGSTELLVVSGAFVALCVLAPLIAFVAATADRGRRALHDRVAGTVVIRLD